MTTTTTTNGTRAIRPRGVRRFASLAAVTTAPLFFVVCLLTVRIEEGGSFLLSPQFRARPPHSRHRPQYQQKQQPQLQLQQRRQQLPRLPPSHGGSALSSTAQQKQSGSGRSRSRVSDPSGAVPPPEEVEFPPVNMEDLPETKYDMYKPCVPHQPWRRGETAGCEDPIDSEWRKEAERRIQLAVEISGGTYVDVTWFLTCVVVTIGNVAHLPRDVVPPSDRIRMDVQWADLDQNPYIDPSDPNPPPLDGSAATEADRVVWEREDDTEMMDDIKSKTYARPDREEGETEEMLGLDPDDIGAPPLYVDQEFPEDELLRKSLERDLADDTEPRQILWDDEDVVEDRMMRKHMNVHALSKIADAILKALEEDEDELQVLARHEVVLQAEGWGGHVETQKQFDEKRGCKVAVHTRDPWDSNRVLRGVLLDRNALDVYIKKQGRMVTIPNNFVSYVELVDPMDYMPHPISHQERLESIRVIKEYMNRPPGEYNDLDFERGGMDDDDDDDEYEYDDDEDEDSEDEDTIDVKDEDDDEYNDEDEEDIYEEEDDDN